jgi:hypothetical protein
VPKNRAGRFAEEKSLAFTEIPNPDGLARSPVGTLTVSGNSAEVIRTG